MVTASEVIIGRDDEAGKEEEEGEGTRGVRWTEWGGKERQHKHLDDHTWSCTADQASPVALRGCSAHLESSLTMTGRLRGVVGANAKVSRHHTADRLESDINIRVDGRDGFPPPVHEDTVRGQKTVRTDEVHRNSRTLTSTCAVSFPWVIPVLGRMGAWIARCRNILIRLPVIFVEAESDGSSAFPDHPPWSLT